LSSWQNFQNSRFSLDWKLEVEEVSKALVIVKAIKGGIAIAVSNGSFKNGRGAMAWTIKGSLASNKITGACLVPGTEDDHSTFCSELMGLLGILMTIHYLLEDYKGGSEILWVCCNGKSALG